MLKLVSAKEGLMRETVEHVFRTVPCIDWSFSDSSGQGLQLRTGINTRPGSLFMNIMNELNGGSPIPEDLLTPFSSSRAKWLRSQEGKSLNVRILIRKH